MKELDLQAVESIVDSINEEFLWSGEISGIEQYGLEIHVCNGIIALEFLGCTLWTDDYDDRGYLVNDEREPLYSYLLHKILEEIEKIKKLKLIIKKLIKKI